MKTTSVKSSWFSSTTNRLDAEFHLSDAVKTRKLLEQAKSLLPLNKVTQEIFLGNIFRRTFVKDAVNGLPYITASDMINTNINTGKFLSKKLTLKQNRLILKKDWILLSCSGTLGNVIYTNEEFEGKIGTHDLIRIIPSKNSKALPGFLYAYLASKYGYTLLTQPSYGGVVKHIEPHHVSDLPVPIFEESTQKEIHNLILEASKLRVIANEIIRKTQLLFSNRLGVSQIDLNRLNSRTEKDLGNIYKRKFDEINPISLRSRNYSERKNRIIETLKKDNWEKLIDVLEREPFYGLRFKRIESRSNKGIELLSQGNLFDNKPKGRIISSRNVGNIEQEIVRRGTIIVPGQGTLGENEIFARAQYVWGYLEDKLIAGHAMRFIPNSRIQSGYLYCVLSSPFWFRLLRNSVYGTNLLGFIVPMLIEYPVPRFEAEFESNISEKINSAYEKLTLSIEKEKSAIHLIEKEIESWQN